MKLQAGSRLGVYEVIGPLGSGGMGDVYRARDTRLGRHVAIKVVPAAFANDSERLVRFDREAQTLAALNHPHIAQIYGVEDSGPTPGLVMELVEGLTLDDVIQQRRTARGDASGAPSRYGLPISEALQIARQIAEALAAAHDVGVIHRDLKPANIKVRDDGTVKVLDFGLAKLRGEDPLGAPGPPPENSPTVTSPATQIGVILGTAAYMAPEQAKGKVVDRRADVWAFGVVLYEMLSGERAFAGDDVTDTLAFIITREPDWSALPPGTPPAIRTLLRRCLEKDRGRRLSDLGDARLEIEDAIASPRHQQSVGVTGINRRWPRFAVALAAIAAIASGGVWIGRGLAPAAHQPMVRFAAALPPGERLVGAARWLAVSPDGGDIVVSTISGLFRRSMGAIHAVRISGSERFDTPFYPVFSPDGRALAFWAPIEQEIRTIAVDGGPTALVTKGAYFSGMSWGAQGLLVAQRSTITLFEPGSTRSRTVLTLPAGESALHPQLVGTDAVLFTLMKGRLHEASSRRSIVVQRISSGTRTTVVEEGSDGVYLPTGHLAYAAAGVLYAIPFDGERLEPQGRSQPLVQGIRTVGNNVPSAQFAVSSTGTLAYLPGPVTGAGAQVDLALFGPAERVEQLKVPSGAYEAPRMAPDGKHVAVSTDDGKEANVWIVDVTGTMSITRLTYVGRNRFPVWSSDGQRVAFQSDRDGDHGIFAQRIDGTGTPERLTRADASTSHRPESWGPKDQHLLFTIARDNQFELHSLSLADKRITPFGGVKSTAPVGSVFSPDGRWVAYAVSESDIGRSVAYVQPFPATGARHQISRDDDGHHPVWSTENHRLFYVPRPQRMAMVEITPTPRFVFTPPRELPPAGLMGPPMAVRSFDILPDGRFVGILPAEWSVQAAAPVTVHVVLNWFDELRGIRF